jgi:nitrite reductase/ring-hydroxylating ferredoxin subunit
VTRTRLTTVEEVPENGSFLFTVRERDGTEEEVILVRCSPAAGGDVEADAGDVDGDAGDDDSDADDAADRPHAGASGGADDDREWTVRAWRNFCQHETDQRLDRGFGAAVRDGEVVCPKHGSMFDTCTGYCDRGKAADSYLSDVEVTVDDGVVYLTDAAVEFSHTGGVADGDDDGPSSTSHLSF